MLTKFLLATTCLFSLAGPASAVGSIECQRVCTQDACTNPTVAAQCSQNCRGEYMKACVAAANKVNPNNRKNQASPEEPNPEAIHNMLGDGDHGAASHQDIPAPPAPQTRHAPGGHQTSNPINLQQPIQVKATSRNTGAQHNATEHHASQQSFHSNNGVCPTPASISDDLKAIRHMLEGMQGGHSQGNTPHQPHNQAAHTAPKAPPPPPPVRQNMQQRTHSAQQLTSEQLTKAKDNLRKTTPQQRPATPGRSGEQELQEARKNLRPANERQLRPAPQNTRTTPGNKPTAEMLQAQRSRLRQVNQDQQPQGNIPPAPPLRATAKPQGGQANDIPPPPPPSGGQKKISSQQ